MARLDAPATLVVLGALTLGCASSSSDSDDPNPRADVLAGVELSMSAAVAKAAAEVEGGVVVEAELELGDGGATYEVEFLVGGVARELVLDAGDGHVLANEVDEEDQAEAEASAARLAESEVDLARAIETVERELGGSVFEAELGDEGFALAVLVEGKPTLVVVSLEDASILAREPLEVGPESDAKDEEDDAADDAGEADDTDDVN